MRYLPHGTEKVVPWGFLIFPCCASEGTLVWVFLVVILWV